MVEACDLFFERVAGRDLRAFTSATGRVKAMGAGMNRKKSLPWVMGLILAILLLSGCGGTATEPTTVPPTTTTIAESIPPTATSIPPTDTPILPMATLVPPTDTPILPTTTDVPPTATATQEDATPTNTSVPPTPTPTQTPIPPSSTPTTMVVLDVDIVVDNQDPTFSTTGSWFVGDGGQSYNGNCHWTPRGVSSAYVRPELPATGAYEVFAWWCGDPDHNQSQRARISIYPYQGVLVPYQVNVNLQENAGQWNSLGTYDLGPESFVSIDGNLNGNVVADAFRFVYRSSEPTVITPTPFPTQDPTTHNPPSPLEQLTSGDLSQRLGLVQRFYPHTPMISFESTTFDDCQAFPRDGCGGSRDGWQVQVQYQDMVVPYRVSQDYWFVAIDPPEELAVRQSLYLYGARGNRFFRVDRYPDDTWHLSSGDYESTTASHLPLDAELVNELRTFVLTYSSVSFLTPDDLGLHLYGLGNLVQLSEEDKGKLAALGAKLTDALGW